AGGGWLTRGRVLAGVREPCAARAEGGAGVRIALDKLDKLAPAEVTAELAGRGLPEGKAAELVAAMTAGDAAERISDALKSSEEGSAGLDEVNALLSLLAGQLPAGRVEFTPPVGRRLSSY